MQDRNLQFVGACLPFVELAAALPVYFEHTGRGDACRSLLSSTLPAMECLEQGSWLRSVWKAFPFGPQFACALGAPAHTHTCSRPLMLTDLTNQPSRSRERRGGQRRGTCNLDSETLRRAKNHSNHVNRTSVFIHPVCSRAGKEGHNKKANRGILVVIQ